jgi:hypothetical protein
MGNNQENSSIGSNWIITFSYELSKMGAQAEHARINRAPGQHQRCLLDDTEEAAPRGAVVEENIEAVCSRGKIRHGDFPSIHGLDTCP